MLEMSRNLIGSIERNLKEFGENSNDIAMPDFIGDHRRPNSAGAIAALGNSMEEMYFEEEEEEHPFDPSDYAFKRGTTRPSSSSAASSALLTNPSSPGQRSPTQPMSSPLHSVSNSSWPTKRCVLHSMESIICGELFLVDYIWVPERKNTELVAKYYVNK